MDDAPLRVYLAGSVRLERGPTLVRERDLPGRQGRLAFAMLAAERDRALYRDELADQLWAGEPPGAWDVALRALVSKLRGILATVGLDDRDTIAHAFGCYQLKLPADAWVDLEGAADAVHRAETSLGDGDLSDAMGWALAANAVARRGFLPGESASWAAARRTELQGIRVRALECRAEVNLRRADAGAAARDAELVIGLEPFRESAHRLVMRALEADGNHAEALRAFARCRRLIGEELGVDPSRETEAVYLEILRSG